MTMSEESVSTARVLVLQLLKERGADWATYQELREQIGAKRWNIPDRRLVLALRDLDDAGMVESRLRAGTDRWEFCLPKGEAR